MTEMRQHGGQQPANTYIAHSDMSARAIAGTCQRHGDRSETARTGAMAVLRAHKAGGAPGDGEEDVHPALVRALRQPRVDDHGCRGHCEGYGRQEGHLCKRSR